MNEEKINVNNSNLQENIINEEDKKQKDIVGTTITDQEKVSTIERKKQRFSKKSLFFAAGILIILSVSGWLIYGNVFNKNSSGITGDVVVQINEKSVYSIDF